MSESKERERDFTNAFIEEAQLDVYPVFQRFLFESPVNSLSILPVRATNIGVGRFRILGRGGARFIGGGGGGKGGGGQIPSRHMTSMRRNDVASTSFRCHVPTRFLINQCQIITFIILKSDIIENSRIELRGIVLPVPPNQIKVTFIIHLPFNLVHL